MKSTRYILEKETTLTDALGHPFKEWHPVDVYETVSGLGGAYEYLTAMHPNEKFRMLKVEATDMTIKHEGENPTEAQ